MKRLLSIILIATFIVFLSGCLGKKAQKPAAFAAPVTVATAVKKSIPIELNLIGAVQPITSVQVKSQVGGILAKVHFREGDYVKKGDPLFTIDTAPFEAAVREARGNLEKSKASVVQARADLERTNAAVNAAAANVDRDATTVKQATANVEKDKAQADNADAELKRYKYLLEKGFTTQEQYDQIRTNSESIHATMKADIAAIETARANLRSSQASLVNAQAAVRSQEATLNSAIATVKASEAMLDSAKIQLSFCHINSSMDGRTGSLIVQAGNVVKADADTGMVVINQITPIYVSFPVPEQYLDKIRDLMSSGKLSLEAIPTQAEKSTETGFVTFVDNNVDSTTGTFLIKGTFQNEKRALWPGQFVNVILKLSTIRDAIIVPSQAVETGQQGSYVFVVKPDNTVKYKPVITGVAYEGGTIIEQGVEVGETVVTDGQVRLVDGTRIEIRKSLQGASGAGK